LLAFTEVLGFRGGSRNYSIFQVRHFSRHFLSRLCCIFWAISCHSGYISVIFVRFGLVFGGIFQRKDGLLFLYSEVDEAVAEADKLLPPPPSNDVNERCARRVVNAFSAENWGYSD